MVRKRNSGVPFSYMRVSPFVTGLLLIGRLLGDGGLKVLILAVVLNMPVFRATMLMRSKFLTGW